jgi:hypothetical protein
MAAGYMNDHTDMFGFRMSFIMIGDLFTMENGFGIRLLVGPGFPMILGDGVHTATVGGTGGSVLAGIGFQLGFGGQPGFTGTGDMIT